jgi:hypothetical protein
VFGCGDGLCFGFSAEDEAAALAAFVGGVVDLLPEGNEVVDGGDDGDDGHPVDGSDSDEVDADDVATPVPVVPAVGEDGGDDGDDLDNGFELADLTGFDGETFGGGDAAEAGDEELAANDKDGDPGFDDAGVVADEDDVSGGDKELVGQGVEKHAHGGDLVAATGEVAVETIGDAGKDEEDAGEDLLFAAEEARGSMSAGKREGGREYPDEQRNAGNAAHRNGVWQVHRLVLNGCRRVRGCAVPTLAFCHSETGRVVKGRRCSTPV